MSVFIALLRAVNVGRTGRVDMPTLRAACEAAGLQEVRTYINSGNVVFTSDKTREELRDLLQQIVEQNFGLSANRVVVLTPDELHSVIKNNPFPDSALQNPNTLHVHFLLAPPRSDADLMLTSYKGPDRLRRAGSHVYISYAVSVASSDLTASFLEKALGSPGTARNWTTCLALLALAQGGSA